MPTYEYRCAHCDRTFDVVQSFHDDPLTECPTCGKPVRKVFGNVGIVFKGSGFYKNDSRTPGRVKESVGADSPPDSPAPKSEGTAEGAKATKEPAGAKGDKESVSSGAAPTRSASNGATSEKKASKPVRVPDAAH